MNIDNHWNFRKFRHTLKFMLVNVDNHWIKDHSTLKYRIVGWLVKILKLSKFESFKFEFSIYMHRVHVVPDNFQLYHCKSKENNTHTKEAVAHSTFCRTFDESMTSRSWYSVTECNGAIRHSELWHCALVLIWCAICRQIFKANMGVMSHTWLLQESCITQWVLDT